MKEVVERAREQVAKVAALMASSGLVTGTWGNLSLRLPAEEDLVVITPSGVPYDTIRERDMVVLNLAGELIEGVRRPSTEYRLHLGIYRFRDDIGAVMHTHSVYATALAVAGVPLPPILEDLVQVVGGGVPVARYARAGTEELARAAIDSLGRGNAVLLANHGVVGVGRDLEECFRVCQVVERAAQIFIMAQTIGRPAVLPPGEIAELRRFYIEEYGQRGGNDVENFNQGRSDIDDGSGGGAHRGRGNSC